LTSGNIGRSTFLGAYTTPKDTTPYDYQTVIGVGAQGVGAAHVVILGALGADTVYAGLSVLGHTGVSVPVGYTIAQVLALGTPVDGTIAYVKDTVALAPTTWHAALAGGGSTSVSGYVFYSSVGTA